MKKNTTVKVTSRFMNAKMLMFAKVTLVSFIYDVIDVFDFPNEYVRSIFYKKYFLQVLPIPNSNRHRYCCLVFCFRVQITLFHNNP